MCVCVCVCCAWIKTAYTHTPLLNNARTRTHVLKRTQITWPHSIHTHTHVYMHARTHTYTHNTNNEHTHSHTLLTGAARLSMPAVPEQQFVNAVKSIVAANRDFVSVAECVLGGPEQQLICGRSEDNGCND